MWREPIHATARAAHSIIEACCVSTAATGPGTCMLPAGGAEAVIGGRSDRVEAIVDGGIVVIVGGAIGRLHEPPRSAS